MDCKTNDGTAEGGEVGMTYGQLFMKLNPNVKVVENGTCVWIYFDSANHDTFRTEWWNKEIPDEVLKAQEPVEPRYIDGKRNHFIKCGNCNTDLMRGMKYCSYCGKAVKWK